MSLRALIQKQVDAGMKQLGDLRQTVTYREKPTFDEDTGLPVPGAEYETDAGVEIAFQLFEVDGTVIQAGDRSWIFPELSIDFVPAVDGYILTPDGGTYAIVAVIPDTAGATYTVHARGNE